MKLKDVTQEMIDKVCLEAIENGWSFKVYDVNTGMVSFVRIGGERINIYLTTMTVVTAINHPAKGRNQLYRKNLSYKEMVKILKNPRQHTGEGYREKRK